MADIYDTFTRADGVLSMTESGHTWSVTGQGVLDGADIGVHSNRLTAGTELDTPLTNNFYAFCTGDGPLSTYGGTCSWVAGSGTSNTQSVTIIAAKDSTSLSNMVHLRVSPTDYSLGIWHSDTGAVNKPFDGGDSESGSFSPALSKDGTTYDIRMDIDVDSESVTCYLPDGRIITCTDPLIPEVVDSTGAWQVYDVAGYSDYLGRWDYIYASEAPLSATALFSTAEARAFDKGQLASTTDYPTSAISAKEEEIREWLTEACKVDFSPTAHSDEYHDGDGTGRVMLDWPMPRSVTSVSYRSHGSSTWTDLTADQLAVCSFNSSGLLVSEAEVFPAGVRTVKVSYIAGHDAVPDLIKRAALMICVTELPATNVPFAADSYDEGGMSISFGRGDGFNNNWHRIPDAVKAIRLYSYNPGGIA